MNDMSKWFKSITASPISQRVLNSTKLYLIIIVRTVLQTYILCTDSKDVQLY